MLSTETILLTVAICFLAAFTRAAIGFGDALIAMPLLSLLLGVRLATPLFAVAELGYTIVFLIKSWHDIQFAAARRLIIASLLGIPLGLWLIKFAPERLILSLLGGLLMLFGLYNLFTPNLPTLKNPRFVYLFGFFSGMLGGAYNTSGPPVVMYGIMAGWTPAQFRATLQIYFLSVILFSAAGHAFTGLWSVPMFQLALYATPATFVALYMGNKLHQRLPAALFRRLVYLFLVAIGIFLLI